MHISITGDLGSGKSTIAKELCNLLKLNYLSTGMIQRKLALDMKMNTFEFNKYSNSHAEVDEYIDQQLIDINNQKEVYILDSRLAYHFVKESFKIYLIALDNIAANRVVKDNTRIGESYTGKINDKIEELKARKAMEAERFERTYGLKQNLFVDFDVIIDSSHASIDELVVLIAKLYEKAKQKKSFPSVWLSPLRIIKSDFCQHEHNISASSKNGTLSVSCYYQDGDFYLISGDEVLKQAIATEQHIISVSMCKKQ